MTIFNFPDHFIWGAATAAYQIEGAYNQDGRGASIWDTFSHTPGKVRNGDNGNVACNSYERFPEDIEAMNELGIQFYRFSISWPRIFPEGSGEVNAAGVAYYHRLVDALLSKGIEPFCTLYHWDLPQALQEDGGWENRSTIDAFTQYAAFIFKEFAGKIKYWVTINEPWCASFLSYYTGEHAPGIKDLSRAMQVSHHLLIAHGKAVKALRVIQPESKIGLAPNVAWSEPYTSSIEDAEACRRSNAWYYEWYLDPIFKGVYPEFMMAWFEQKGGSFAVNEEDMKIIHQPIDFLGINYYSGSVARYKENEGLFDCEAVDMGYVKTDIGWSIYPEGISKGLSYIALKYDNPIIYITENGACYNDTIENGRVKDDRRIHYLQIHLAQLHACLESGINIKGYITWSLLDNFEWSFGYSMRFGLIHVDFDTLIRTKKDSFYWFKKIVNANGLETK